MAKPITKKKPHKKHVGENKLRKLADAVMKEFEAEAKARYTRAHKAYAQQDDDTQETIDRITTFLLRIARKNMWVGIGNDKIVMTIPESTLYHNMFYMACEILKDLALMDVRVSSYTFPANLCAECGIELKPTKAKKKVKRG